MRPIVSIVLSFIFALTWGSAEVFAREPWQAFTGLAISPDQRTFLTMGKSGELRTWDVFSGEPDLLTPPAFGEIRSATFLNSSKEIVVVNSGAEAFFLEGANSQKIVIPGQKIRIATFQAGFLFVATDSCRVMKFQIQAGAAKPVVQFPTQHKGYIKSIQISPDGAFIATSGDDGRIEIRKALDGSLFVEWRVSMDWVRQTIWDGQGFLTISDDHAIRSWSSKGVLLWEVKTSSLPTSLATNGKICSVGFDEGSIYSFDRINGKSICSWKPHSAPVSGMAFTSKENELISCSLDSILALQNAESGKTLGIIRP